MNEQRAESAAVPVPKAAAWGAVISMMLGLFALSTAKFLPPSVLTPIASDLGISVGLAGQTVTAAAAMAVAASLLIPSCTRRMDRRNVLLGLSVLLIASNLIVAFAPDFALLLLGCAVLGIAIGGFWAMSMAIVMRLVPERVPRGLAIVMSGFAAATIVATPAGSWLGAVIGWRGVFLLAAALGLLALIVQWLTLPSMAPRGQANLRTLVDVLKRPHMRSGLIAVLLIWGGNSALFTYIRPFLQEVTGVTITGVTAILLAFGVANYVGSHLGGVMLKRHAKLTMALMPLLMGAIGIALASAHGAPATTLALVAIWGLVFGTIPVAWTTWITRVVPNEAESGGGLLVAAVQVAIAVGAGAGGILVNLGDVASVFMVGGAVLVAAALFIALAVTPGTRAQQPDGLAREEATAMLAGEIGSAVDYATIRGDRVARRSVNTSGELS
ncbi:MAG: MFS transporter [Rhodanobacteraceae bacterium]